MPACIAMLRGINVGGQKPVPMEQLRKLCAALGFRSIQTYVQSGNIVFLDAEKSPSNLAKRISDAILDEFGFHVPVLVKTAKVMGEVIKCNPFLKETGIDPSKLHVTFLSDAASKGALKNLEGFPTSPDRFHLGRQEIYLYCPGGYGRTKLSNNAFEKALSMETTTRNWKTVGALFEMASKL
jgi:uncharacterized protein (DUF1697 family)